MPAPALSDIVTRLRTAGCVFAEEEAQLLVSAARTPAELHDLVERRVSGLPLEHVLGWAEFCGLRMAVDVGVFVPRRRTELLVREARTPISAGGRRLLARITARGDPLLAQRAQATTDVDGRGGVRVRARRVVHGEAGAASASAISRIHVDRVFRHAL